MFLRQFSVFILFFIINDSFAENKLFLCNEYDNAGNYKGVFEDWQISKDGNFMYIFFESSEPVTDTLFVSLYRTNNRRDTFYNEYDHYYLVPGANKKFAVNKYIFSKPGNYKISVSDRNGKEMAKPYNTTVKLNDADYINMNFVDTWYYNSSVILFYEKTIGDSLIGMNTVFEVKTDEDKVVLYIGQKNKQPFKTRHFYSRIYTADACRKLIDESVYYVDETWSWTYVSLFIQQTGKFIVELYNDDDVFINSAPIEIK